MSSTIDPSPATPPADPKDAELAALRVELDRLDDVLHDTLMARAEVVAQVGALKGGVGLLRPGREASILRRLLARHQGRLKPLSIVRIWRELLAGTTSMQGAFAIAVCDADGGLAFLAREHFGALTPHRIHRSAAQALAEVMAGTVSAAVLPFPAEEGEGRSWWTSLISQDQKRLHIVARLPIWSPRPDGTPRVEALVVAANPPDPSGPGPNADRTCIVLEVDAEQSRARLVAAMGAAGFETDSVLIHRPPGAPVAYALADVAGFVTDDDARLAAIGVAQRPPVVLGAYAVPLAGTP